MEEILYKYLPHESVIPCFALIKKLGIDLKIVNERQSGHGDYQKLPNGQHKITINANLNKYQGLMQPFLRPEIFPAELLSYLVIHFQNPSASSDTDVHLSLAMQQYDTEERRKHYLFELPTGSFFRTDDGRLFRKGEKKIKRYECTEVETNRKFVVQPHALVERVELI